MQRVGPAVPGLRAGGADGAPQLWLPGGTSADRSSDGRGVSGRPARRQRSGEEGALVTSFSQYVFLLVMFLAKKLHDLIYVLYNL